MASDGAAPPPLPQRLQSPEELDRLVTITTPLGWLALGTVGFVVLAAVVWGFVGSIPTTVSGDGILLRGGRIASVVALGTGKVASLDVAVGNRVAAGQVVGTITQPTLEAQIEGQKATVAKLQANYDTVKAEQTRGLQEQMVFLAKQRDSTAASITSYQQLVKSLTQIVASQKQLMDKGLIPATSYIQTQSQLSQTQISLLQAENQLKKIDADETSAKISADQAIFAAETQLVQAKSQLDDLQTQLAETSKLVASNDGEVIGLVALPGQAVSTGDTVVSIEALNESMKALVYMTSGLGKRVQTGMTMQVSPGTAEVYDYGYIVARVTAVSEAPATQEAMLALLGNQRLVESFTEKGAPIAVEADLELDHRTPSGFRWSSSKGPPFEIRSGTLCSARVITQEQRPITLVIPLLKELFGIRA
ncbi:MAG: NHLP bacteriocin system secretion protein [Thermodesulfobacteriota bacterium]